MKNILNPTKKILILFGILSMVLLTLYVWNYSFAWEFVFGVTHYIVLLLIVLIIGILISSYIDKKNKTKLKYYFIISLIQLLIIWSVANPIREWQVENAKKQGFQIVKLIDKYKLENKENPKSLIELEKEQNVDIPKRTKIGTKYAYKVYENGSYGLSFKSYYGYDFNYDKDSKKWISAD
ncbi:hypothetical protein QSV08_15315 [Maribacter sp. BPC-D8]|uniref:hypothetical protein n=1 Tax=Maribacter sp. BPC-D8 TaxID=3053613 RepID=UPI002B461D15|nr:hypothetical protein [Maribacter sp. BPC-D8]WRI28584.1 hypothetical protein QSV08_15315 [Maribacter sp. BPC-D8]